MHEAIIVGAGIGGLTLALTLHHVGIPCRVYESSAEIRPIGVGINVLPHAAKELAALGLQVSIHRGVLQMLLLDAVRERLGHDSVLTGYRCVGVEQGDDAAIALFADRDPVRGRAVIACDGTHSAIRKQFCPAEGAPLYSGYNMWRGVTVWPRFMTGASMVRAGWLANGKMVIYPIRDLGDGKQLINCLSGTADVPAALTQYEALRLPPTTQVVLMHRKNPPDAILREVNERTGGKPFARIGDVIPEAELRAIAELYKTVAGYDKKALAG